MKIKYIKIKRRVMIIMVISFGLLFISVCYGGLYSLSNHIEPSFDITKKYKIIHKNHRFKIIQKLWFLFDKEVFYNPDYLNYLIDKNKFSTQKQYDLFKYYYEYKAFMTENDAKEYIQLEIDKLNKSKITEKEVINNLYKENEYLQQRLQELLNK